MPDRPSLRVLRSPKCLYLVAPPAAASLAVCSREGQVDVVLVLCWHADTASVVRQTDWQRDLA
jgi:hypothetical protein